MFFLALSPKVKETKAKINKGDPIKSFCTAKEIINKTKKQPKKQKKIYTNNTTKKE